MMIPSLVLAAGTYLLLSWVEASEAKKDLLTGGAFVAGFVVVAGILWGRERN
jgi:hypothetical protein